MVEPNAIEFQRLLTNISILPSYDGGDTGFLNACYPDWYSDMNASARLPFGYNAQRTMYWFTYEKRPGYWDSIDPLKVNRLNIEIILCCFVTQL